MARSKTLVTSSRRRAAHARSPRMTYSWLSASTEELVGGVNDLERKYAPPTLYYAGDVSLFKRRPKVSIVGSRDASEEGLKRAAKLIRALVAERVVIVSGLARGIDATAHRAAIADGGRTIAVLGTPIDRVYPREHTALQEQIGREHLVVSQFPIGTLTKPYHFPERNRMMALLVDASVIVEAGDGSGSLSQGWEALRLNRALFIMRSIFDRPGLKWPHEMRDYGAKVLQRPEDLIENLPFGEPAEVLI